MNMTIRYTCYLMLCVSLLVEARADLKVFPPCFRGNKTHLLNNQPNMFWLYITGQEVAGKDKVTITVTTDKLVELYPCLESQLSKQASDEGVAYTFTGNPASVPGIVLISHQPPNASGRIRVTVAAQDKQLFQQSVDYTVLPSIPLDVLPPKDFQLFFWSIADWRMTGKWIPNEIQQQFADIMVKGLGYEYLSMYWGGDASFGRLAKQRGVKLILAQMSPFGGTGVPESAFPPESVGKTYRGEKVVPIMQWAIGHPELLDRLGFGVYKGVVKQDFCDGVNDDFEPGGADYNSHDDLTLNAFSKWSGIPRSEMSHENLRGKYYADWTNFKVWQNTEYIRLYADAMRKVKPNVEVYICAQPLPPVGDETKFLAYQGVDPRSLDPYVDAHVPMMYSANRPFYDEVERTAKALAKPLIPLSQLSYGPEADNVVRPVEDVVMGFYSALTGGAEGYSFYNGTYAWGDGAYFQELAKAWRQVQPFEQVFTRGCRAEDEVNVAVLPSAVTTYVDETGKKQTLSQAVVDDSVAWRAHRKGERLVVSVFNFAADAKFVQVKPDRRWPSAYSIQSNKKLPQDKGTAILKVGGVSVSQVLFSDDSDPIAKNKPVSDSDRAAYQKFVNKREFPALRSGGVAVYGTLTVEKQPAVVLSGAASRALVVPDNGGRIVSWQVDGKELAGFMKAEKYAGGIGVDLFWYPATAGWQANEYAATYQVEAGKIVSGVPQLTVSRVLEKSELKGLKVSKTYRLSGKDTLEIEHAFTNTTDKPLTFSYWGHNSPQIPLKPDENKTHFSQFRPVWPETGGEQKAHLDERAVGEVFALPDAPLTPGRESWEKGARQQTISDSWFALESRVSPERVTVSVERDKLLQFYSAFAAVPPTMEWMSKLMTLKPGESWMVRETITLSP